MKQIKSVSVCGLGKLGACIAATYANAGFKVVGIDLDQNKIDKINSGLAPVEEPGLSELMKTAKDNLFATDTWGDLVDTDITFFITPSPSLPDGSFSNEFLLSAMRSLASALKSKNKKGHIFACCSTTTPGSCDSVLIPAIEKESGYTCGVDFGFCYNPEFIALGNVIKGLMEPDMVLIGESDKESGDALQALYASYNKNKPTVSRMSLVSAELTKISVNSYITTKISFTNQLRMIAGKFDRADIHDILDAIGSDSRIGKKYLKSGLGYGGPCFPRDNRLLAYVARSVGLKAPIAEAADQVNEMSHSHLFDGLRNALDDESTVLVLGLSYKPDTHITEESAGIILANALKSSGYKVLVHDFAVNRTTNKEIHHLDYLHDISDLETRGDIHAAVICCPWPGYKNIKLNDKTILINHWNF
jgi:UDPglucose 6-dehydrogenase